MIDYNSSFTQQLWTVVSHDEQAADLGPRRSKGLEENVGIKIYTLGKISAPNILIKRIHIKEEWCYFWKTNSCPQG